MNKSSKVFVMGLVGVVVIAISYWKPIPEYQSYTKESSLHKNHSESMFVNEQRTITTLLQKQDLIKERPEIKLNGDPTVEQKIVNTLELEKTEKEKRTVTTEPQQATAKAPEHSKSKTKSPTMGNTRVVNGQKQVYFLGFGWIEDENKPNEEIFAEDMYENGNKIAEMDGSAVVDSDGDINKMVGTMGD